MSKSYRSIPQSRRHKYATDRDGQPRVVQGDSRYKNEGLFKLKEVRMLLALVVTAGVVAAVFGFLR